MGESIEQLSKAKLRRLHATVGAEALGYIAWCRSIATTFKPSHHHQAFATSPSSNPSNEGKDALLFW